MISVDVVYYVYILLSMKKSDINNVKLKFPYLSYWRMDKTKF